MLWITGGACGTAGATVTVGWGVTPITVGATACWAAKAAVLAATAALGGSMTEAVGMVAVAGVGEVLEVVAC